MSQSQNPCPKGSDPLIASFLKPPVMLCWKSFTFITFDRCSTCFTFIMDGYTVCILYTSWKLILLSMLNGMLQKCEEIEQKRSWNWKLYSDFLWAELVAPTFHKFPGSNSPGPPFTGKGMGCIPSPEKGTKRRDGRMEEGRDPPFSTVRRSKSEYIYFSQYIHTVRKICKVYSTIL